MPKASQLAADPRTEIAWLLPTLVQFRVTGRAYIVPASGMGATGSLSRSGSLKVSPSYKSPRHPPTLRRSPSNASNLSPHPTPPIGSESDPLRRSPSTTSERTLSPHPTPPASSDPVAGSYVTATPARMTSDDANLSPKPETSAESSSASTKTESSSTDVSGSTARSDSGALSRTSSTKSRPQLHLTPTPTDLASSTSAGRESSPIISTPRSQRCSPPLSASSSSSHAQFHLRPNTALNPAVTLGDGSDISIPSLAGTLSALVSWGVTPMSPESSPSWWEAERGRIWDSLSPALRATFARPAPPGTTLADAPSPESWITRLETHAKTPEEAKSLTFAWEHFAVVALAPERVEMLELACEPHRRACWVRDGDGWVKEELVP